MPHTAEATEFVKRASSGANQPLLLKAEHPKDGSIEVYVKPTEGLLTGVKGAIAEAISSLLAHDLQLAIPEPVYISISDEFIDSLDDAEIAGRLKRSERTLFGSKNLSPGVQNVMHDIPIKKRHEKQCAIEIFAFDALIDNPDRGTQNGKRANCLIKDGKFYLIDHEKAFGTVMTYAIGLKKPWEMGGLAEYNQASSHLFINQLRSRKAYSKLNLKPFMDKWKKVDDHRLDEYLSDLPAAWLSTEKDAAIKALDRIRDVGNHMEGCKAEIMRILEHA